MPNNYTTLTDDIWVLKIEMFFKCFQTTCFTNKLKHLFDNQKLAISRTSFDHVFPLHSSDPRGISSAG